MLLRGHATAVGERRGNQEETSSQMIINNRGDDRDMYMADDFPKKLHTFTRFYVMTSS